MQSVIQTVRATANTGATTQDVTVSGFGTVVACFGKISLATADNTNVAHGFISVGIWDGTNTRGKSTFSENNRTAVTDTNQMKRTDRFFIVMAAAGVVTRYVTLSAVTNGVKLSWFDSAGTPTAPGVAYKLDLTFVGGSGALAAIVDVAGAITSRVISSLSFQSDSLVCLGPGVFGTAAAAAPGQMILGFATRAPSISQCSLNWTDTDNVSTSAAISLLSATSVAVLTGASQDNARVSAFSSTGFTFTNDVQNNAFPDFAVLALQLPGLSVLAEVISSPTGTGVQSYTNLGMRGQAGILAISGASAVDTVTNDDKASTFALSFLGTPTGTPVENVTHVRSKDAVVISGPSPTIAGAIADAKFVRLHNGGNTALLVANWNAWQASGVDVNWTTVDGTARKIAALWFSAEVVQPSGIASEEAFGSATIAATIAVSPSGIASAEAFGTPTLAATVTLFPGGIASDEAFGTPTLAPGAVAISPSGIASAEALGNPTLSPGAVTLSPGGIASDEAFGTPTLAAGEVVVSPSGVASDEAFGTPTLAATATVDLNGEGIASAEAFGTPMVVTGADIFPSGIDSEEAFGTPDVLAQPVFLSPTSIASAEAFGDPLLSQEQLVLPASIDSEETFGTPSLFTGLTILPDGIVSEEAVGTPDVLAGAVAISPSGIASAEALGNPTLSPGAVTLSPGGIASDEAFGLPAISPGALVLLVDAIASDEAFGTPTLLQAGAQIIDLDTQGIASGEAFGTPLVLSDQQLVQPSGIASGEAFGLPFLRGGYIPVTLKKKVHDALCQAAELGTFIEATYDSDACELEQGLQVRPGSIEVNELDANYAVTSRYGRKFALDPTAWNWLLILQFNEEVICEPFVRRLLGDPICIPRGQDDRQVTLKLVDTKYEHPPREGASNGTKAFFRIQAELSPR